MISKILKILVPVVGILVLITAGLRSTQNAYRLREWNNGVECKDDLTLLIARVKD